MFEIEDIAAPEGAYRGAPTRGGRRSRYPFGEMQKGQSFLVPHDMAHATAVAASYYKSAHPGWDYTRSAEVNGVRFYRIR